MNDKKEFFDISNDYWSSGYWVRTFYNVFISNWHFSDV